MNRVGGTERLWQVAGSILRRENTAPVSLDDLDELSVGELQDTWTLVLNHVSETDPAAIARVVAATSHVRSCAPDAPTIAAGYQVLTSRQRQQFASLLNGGS